MLSNTSRLLTYLTGILYAILGFLLYFLLNPVRHLALVDVIVPMGAPSAT